MADDSTLARERLALDQQKHLDEVRLAEARLAAETARAGRLSSAAVATVGGLIALASAGITAALGGFFGIESENLRADSERERLRLEQQFRIIERATADVAPEVAARNLLFFVDIGFLEDPTGNIRNYAERGEAPQLATTAGAPRANPLVDRLAAVEAELAAEAGAGDSVSSDAFAIRQHLLARGGRVVNPAPSEQFGTLLDRRYVVLHATVGSVQSTIAALTAGNLAASVHLVIARDGTVTQLLPFDLAAWHVGNAQWAGERLQRNSLAVSLENLGRLQERDGALVTALGGHVPEGEAVTLAGAEGESRSHDFPEAQIAATIAVLKALRAAYPEIEDILGHDEVEPRRRVDPGPAFPIERVRLEVLGRAAPLADR